MAMYKNVDILIRNIILQCNMEMVAGGKKKYSNQVLGICMKSIVIALAIVLTSILKVKYNLASLSDI